MKTSKNAHRVTATEQLKNVATQPQHTRGEWKIVYDNPKHITIQCEGYHTSQPIAFVDRILKSEEEAQANAQRIVTCVNEYEALKKKADMHDELIRFVKDFMDKDVMKEWLIKKANQLLQQAETKNKS